MVSKSVTQYGHDGYGPVSWICGSSTKFENLKKYFSELKRYAEKLPSINKSIPKRLGF